MRSINAARRFTFPVTTATLVAAFMGGSLAGPAATRVAQAQTGPATAANGVLLPPPDFDPAASRDAELIESAAIPATPTPAPPPADGSTVTESPEVAGDAPDTVTATPENGNSVTTNLGGSDVAVSSVGGSYEVDGPKKRSNRKRN